MKIKISYKYLLNKDETFADMIIYLNKLAFFKYDRYIKIPFRDLKKAELNILDLQFAGYLKK